MIVEVFKIIPEFSDYEISNCGRVRTLSRRIRYTHAVTKEYNHEHATKSGLKATGSKIGTSKLDEISAHAIKYFLNKGYSHSELAIAFRVSKSTISLISKGLIWSHVLLVGKELEVKL